MNFPCVSYLIVQSLLSALESLVFFNAFSSLAFLVSFLVALYLPNFQPPNVSLMFFFHFETIQSITCSQWSSLNIDLIVESLIFYRMHILHKILQWFPQLCACNAHELISTQDGFSLFSLALACSLGENRSKVHFELNLCVMDVTDYTMYVCVRNIKLCFIFSQHFLVLWTWLQLYRYLNGCFVQSPVTHKISETVH